MEYNLKNYLQNSLQGVVFYESNEELILSCDTDVLLDVCRFLRNDPHCLFKMCVDICGVDYPERPRRFDVVYHLLSIKHNARIRLKVEIDLNISIPSVISIWPSAEWYEREVWDMYGILFSNHPDLRRILTDYGFHGHPQRRDFPLSGYVEVRYDSESGRVRYEPVELTQAFRNFSFLSPWEGYQNIISGDEKVTTKDVKNELLS